MATGLEYTSFGSCTAHAWLPPTPATRTSPSVLQATTQPAIAAPLPTPAQQVPLQRHAGGSLDHVGLLNTAAGGLKLVTEATKLPFLAFKRLTAPSWQPMRTSVALALLRLGGATHGDANTDLGHLYCHNLVPDMQARVSKHRAGNNRVWVES